MKKVIRTLFYILLTPLCSVAENATLDSVPTVDKNRQAVDSKIIIGAIETVRISPPKIKFKARVDTGATTTSMDARDITLFERDGKKWVKFTVLEGKKTHQLERPVSKTVLIKRHNTDAQERFIVKMRMTAGNVTQLIDVSLTDRSDYQYPVLIGRNFLKDYFIVDVSHSFVLHTKKH